MRQPENLEHNSAIVLPIKAGHTGHLMFEEGIVVSTIDGTYDDKPLTIRKTESGFSGHFGGEDLSEEEAGSMYRELQTPEESAKAA